MILLISIFIIKDQNNISNKHIFIDSIINKINLIDLVNEKELKPGNKYNRIESNIRKFDNSKEIRKNMIINNRLNIRKNEIGKIIFIKRFKST